MTDTPLHRAIAAQPFCGSQSAFARAIGTSQQNISNWLRAKRYLPAEYVLKAEEVTGIRREEWRPDIYPPEAANDATDVQRQAVAQP